MSPQQNALEPLEELDELVPLVPLLVPPLELPLVPPLDEPPVLLVLLHAKTAKDMEKRATMTLERMGDDLVSSGFRAGTAMCSLAAHDGPTFQYGHAQSHP